MSTSSYASSVRELKPFLFFSGVISCLCWGFCSLDLSLSFHFPFEFGFGSHICSSIKWNTVSEAILCTSLPVLVSPPWAEQPDLGGKAPYLIITCICLMLLQLSKQFPHTQTLVISSTLWVYSPVSVFFWTLALFKLETPWCWWEFTWNKKF